MSPMSLMGLMSLTSHMGLMELMSYMGKPDIHLYFIFDKLYCFCFAVIAFHSNV